MRSSSEVCLPLVRAGAREREWGNIRPRERTCGAIDGIMGGWEDYFVVVLYILLFLPLVN